jgi:hypothetical protein
MEVDESVKEAKTSPDYHDLLDRLKSDLGIYPNKIIIFVGL